MDHILLAKVSYNAVVFYMVIKPVVDSMVELIGDERVCRSALGDYMHVGIAGLPARENAETNAG